MIALPCLLYTLDLTVLNLALPALSADLQPSSARPGICNATPARADELDRLLGRAAVSGSVVMAGCSVSSAWEVSRTLPSTTVASTAILILAARGRCGHQLGNHPEQLQPAVQPHRVGAENSPAGLDLRLRIRS